VDIIDKKWKGSKKIKFPMNGMNGMLWNEWNEWNERITSFEK
jgi:hypothetical protein